MNWLSKMYGMLMQTEQAPSRPVVPAGYITSGLLLFLDGLQVESNSLWVDAVNGAEFTLYNATKAANGVTFAGDATSYGESTAAFPDGVTIEAAFSVVDASVNTGIFGQNWPNVGDNAQPVVMLAHAATSQCIFVKYGTTNRQVRRAALQSAEIVSAVRWLTDSRAVLNGEQIVSYTQNYAFYPSGGITGSRIGTRGEDMWLHGTLYSIRIYNRALTVAEMQANQAIDNVRYNLGVIS